MRFSVRIFTFSYRITSQKLSIFNSDIYAESWLFKKIYVTSRFTDAKSTVLCEWSSLYCAAN